MEAVTLPKMADGTAGNLISYSVLGDPTAVSTGNSGQVLTSGGMFTEPTFQDLPSSGGTFTNPGSGTPPGESFGASSTADGISAASFGNTAVAAGDGSTAFGSLSSVNALAAYGVAVGYDNDLNASSLYSVLVGAESSSSAASAMGFGHDVSCDHAGSIVFGRGASSGSANSAAFGSATVTCLSLYLGEGEFATSPRIATFSGSKGSGTNKSGTSVRIDGGSGTGTASGGYISFRTADGGTSGSSLNTMVEHMRISANGDITFPGIPTSDPGTGILWSNAGVLTLGS